MKRKIGYGFLIAFTFVFAVMVQAVQAIPTLWLGNYDPYNWVIVQDGGVNDGSSDAGVVTFNGSINNWIVNVTTGITKPVLGSAASPHMDMSSVNVSSGSAGSLWIWFSEDGFGPFSGWLSSSAGGVTSGTVDFHTITRVSGVDDWISNLGPFGPGAFSGTTSAPTSLDASDSLWLGAHIVHSAGIQSTSFNYEVKVPEPTTLILLGAGMLGLGLFRRMRKS